jgi:hypothetical protein
MAWTGAPDKRAASPMNDGPAILGSPARRRTACSATSYG